MRFSLILAFSCSPFAAWAATTIDDSQCVVSLPEGIEAPQFSGNASDPEIRIRADRSEAYSGQTAVFEGNVKLIQGHRQISTDRATIDQQTETITAEGGLIYQDPDVTIVATDLAADSGTEKAELSRADYWLNGKQVHGSAEQILLQENKDISLFDTSFTTCSSDNPEWALRAKSVEIDSETEWGEIWHAKVEVFGTPIFYVPYMTVPITDKRKTGFLFPSFSSGSKNGFDYIQPYYWNIAPNLDATLTTQVMTKRGTAVRGMGRYLQPWGQGQLHLEYLGNDKLAEADEVNDRYLVHFKHSGKLNKNWRLYADYTNISDDNYFTDITSDVQSASDNQISAKGQLAYFESNWNVTFTAHHIDVLGDLEQPYRIMPAVDFNYFQHQLPYGLHFDLNSELTRFEHPDSDQLSATRWHFEPTLSLPIVRPAGSLTSEVKLMQTFYQQDIPTTTDNNDYLGLDESVSRFIPQMRVHGQINFDRKFELGQQQFRQTLEPQFQYLFVPYEDQDNIALYDTGRLQDDYLGLFRDRRYSGLDRIADANQLTVGVASRLFDAGQHEIASVALGQIFYFDDTQVTIPVDGAESTTEQAGTSAIAAEAQWQIDRFWYTHASLQFDSENGELNKSEVLLNYQMDDNRSLQLSHRYVANLGDDVNGVPVDINQVGLRMTWPLAQDIYMFGNYYYDTNLSRSIESLAGIQYESCCWAIQVAYYNELQTDFTGETYDSIRVSNEFDQGFRFNFMLKGLGSTGPLGVADMRDEGRFSYRKTQYTGN
ncbi:LPS assembly protein LptD [Ferrimonas senticii]|uniref:LPS assembly protein LptD n=1 Tax=Ferrimonas senticii TaxID=394566 RepID=UPI000424D825|nr:LPS assembly protein LptD [Ferrimonas senticii]